VRSPLTSLLMAGHALARDPARRPPEEIALAARAMQERCAELIALVDNLLDWGRLRSGAATRAPADLNVAGLVAEAMQPLRAAAETKRLTVTADVPVELSVTVDGYAVQCVLRNLLGNAIKFTPVSGSIQVKARAHGALIEVCISDNGVGMSAEKLGEISAARETTSGEGTAGERGLGLGLSLCRELVARESGTLEFESAPLRGTTARITLPAAA
jgi:two-component system sensor histidine kinase/response regulator